MYLRCYCYILGEKIKKNPKLAQAHFPTSLADELQWHRQQRISTRPRLPCRGASILEPGEWQLSSPHTHPGCRIIPKLP